MRAFLAVADTGSLSAAARALGSSQPTLGRQIKSLETQMDAALFQRQPKGLDLTETGRAILGPAQAMRDAMHQAARSAAGQNSALRGTVRITASVVMAVVHLPPLIAAIRQAEPDIQIELVPSDDSRNLTYREADIAVRMYRPKQLDLVTQHLGDMALGLFAAPGYLAARPDVTPATMMHHDFVGYDADPRIIDGFHAAGIPVGRDFFGVRCDDPMAYWALVQAGCGIGFGQVSIGDADPKVTRVMPDFELPALPIWLTAHETMRQTPRVGRVWDLLRDGLRALIT